MFPPQPTRRELLSEFQAENDVLGVLEPYHAGLMRAAEEMRAELQTAQEAVDREYAATKVKNLEGAIGFEGPVTPRMQQVGNSLCLYLGREFMDSGLTYPDSTLAVARSEAGSGEYSPEPGFSDEQVSALLKQLSRYMLLSANR